MIMLTTSPQVPLTSCDPRDGGAPTPRSSSSTDVGWSQARALAKVETPSVGALTARPPRVPRIKFDAAKRCRSVDCLNTVSARYSSHDYSNMSRRRNRSCSPMVAGADPTHSQMSRMSRSEGTFTVESGLSSMRDFPESWFSKTNGAASNSTSDLLSMDFNKHEGQRFSPFSSCSYREDGRITCSDNNSVKAWLRSFANAQFDSARFLKGNAQDFGKKGRCLFSRNAFKNKVVDLEQQLEQLILEAKDNKSSCDMKCWMPRLTSKLSGGDLLNLSQNNETDSSETEQVRRYGSSVDESGAHGVPIRFASSSTDSIALKSKPSTWMTGDAAFPMSPKVSARGLHSFGNSAYSSKMDISSALEIGKSLASVGAMTPGFSTDHKPKGNSIALTFTKEKERLKSIDAMISRAPVRSSAAELFAKDSRSSFGSSTLDTSSGANLYSGLHSNLKSTLGTSFAPAMSGEDLSSKRSSTSNITRDGYTPYVSKISSVPSYDRSKGGSQTYVSPMSTLLYGNRGLDSTRSGSAWNDTGTNYQFNNSLSLGGLLANTRCAGAEVQLTKASSRPAVTSSKEGAKQSPPRRPSARGLSAGTLSGPSINKGPSSVPASYQPKQSNNNKRFSNGEIGHLTMDQNFSKMRNASADAYTSEGTRLAWCSHQLPIKTTSKETSGSARKSSKKQTKYQPYTPTTTTTKPGSPATLRVAYRTTGGTKRPWSSCASVEQSKRNRKPDKALNSKNGASNLTGRSTTGKSRSKKGFLKTAFNPIMAFYNNVNSNNINIFPE